tara:strand:+ start:324 stop:1802 length:1479 start_codon:yes stop_codon:yes gene_type:complete
MSFQSLGLSSELLRAIADYGYKSPTAIQERAIPSILLGHDILGSAQTGTGKTASFTLPLIDILATGRVRARMPRSLILEPTRELASQVADNFDEYGKYSKLTKVLLVGGQSFQDQGQTIDRGVDVLIATPGRLLDHIERGRLMLSGVGMLVIDEADRMLDMGFIPDVERIVRLTPRTRQTLMFSATLLPEIRVLADAFLSDPKEICVDPPSSTAAQVVQRVVVVNAGDKRKALRSLLKQYNINNALIFCNRKRDIDHLVTSLRKHDFQASGLHGDLAQAVRTETLRRFKAGEVDLLVASDVAARGLDIEALPHVINFDVPLHPEDYIHRIGRTGRAGMEGTTFMLATPEDEPYVSAIIELTDQDISPIKVDGIVQPTLSAEYPPRQGGGSKTYDHSKKPPKYSKGRSRPDSKPNQGGHESASTSSARRTPRKVSVNDKENSNRRNVTGNKKTVKPQSNHRVNVGRSWDANSPIPSFLLDPAASNDKDPKDSQ